MPQLGTVSSTDVVSVLVAGKIPPADLPVSLTKVADAIPLASGAGDLDASWAPTVEGSTLLSGLGYQNGWTDGADPAHFYEDPFGRVYLDGPISGGSLDAEVVTLPSGYRPDKETRWACPYRDSGFAIVQIDSSGVMSVQFAPSDPATENIYLDTISFRAA